MERTRLVLDEWSPVNREAEDADQAVRTALDRDPSEMWRRLEQLVDEFSAADLSTE